MVHDSNKIQFQTSFVRLTCKLLEPRTCPFYFSDRKVDPPKAAYTTLFLNLEFLFLNNLQFPDHILFKILSFLE